MHHSLAMNSVKYKFSARDSLVDMFATESQINQCNKVTSSGMNITHKGTRKSLGVETSGDVDPPPSTKPKDKKISFVLGKSAERIEKLPKRVPTQKLERYSGKINTDRTKAEETSSEATKCPLQCTSDYKFSDLEVLTSHLITFHNFRRGLSRKLATTQFVVENLDSLRNSDVPYCFMCGIKPRNPSRFKDHITNIHALILCYQCPSCLIFTESIDSLNKHYRLLHDSTQFSINLHPVLVNKSVSVFLDSQEKVKTLSILRYLQNHDCKEDGIFSCSCGEWFANYQELDMHAKSLYSCHAKCFGCGTQLISKQEVVSHYLTRPVCHATYREPPHVKVRAPSFLTSRSQAYPGILKCHICEKEFDKCSDEIAVTHFVEDHSFSKRVAERIADLTFLAPIVLDLEFISHRHCFVCDAHLLSVAGDFQKHLSTHKELVMLYECPYCFSLHESDHEMAWHSTSCARLENSIDIPPGFVLPMLFKKTNNSLYEMIPLDDIKKVRALQIMRSFSVQIDKMDEVITSSLPPDPRSPISDPPQSQYQPHYARPKVVCFECEKVSKNVTILRRHLEDAHNISVRTIWPCPICKKTFNTARPLRYHLYQDHKVDEDSAGAIASEGEVRRFIQRGTGRIPARVITGKNASHSEIFHETFRQLQLKLDPTAPSETCGDQLDKEKNPQRDTLSKYNIQLHDSSRDISASHSIPMNISPEPERIEKMSDGCAPCPFCKNLKKSHDLLVAHIVSEHKVKIQPAIRMSEIMYAGEIPKSDYLPPSYTCQQCFKKIKDPVRIKDHAAKHGIILRFCCPECPDLKPTSQELAVHLVEEHDADYEYAVEYTSGTEPVLAIVDGGRESIFKCSEPLLYFLRKSQYSNTARCSGERRCSDTSEESYRQSDHSPTRQSLSSDAKRGINERASDILSKNTDYKHKDNVSTQSQTAAKHVDKDTLDMFVDNDYSNSSDVMDTKQKHIRRELISIRSDLEDMLDRAGLTFAEKSLIHNSQMGDENISNQSSEDMMERDWHSKDKINVIPDKQDDVESTDKMLLKNICNLEKGQSVIFNGKLFLVVNNVDSCLLRKT